MKDPIHIVTTAPASLNNKYVVAQLATHWRAWGHSVTVGPLRTLNDGIGLMHVDQTRVDPLLVPQSTNGGSLLNGKVLDISKSTFSTLRLLPGEGWDGAVIVKSNLNYFGNPERSGLIAKAGRALDRVLWPVTGKTWQTARRLPPNDYPVLNHVTQVPDWVWHHEQLIVERFLPERVGESYAIRGWLFFGEHGYAYRLYSSHPIVKAGNISHFDILDSVPDELKALRRQYCVDFGKFDYVELEGRAVLLDLNKTPTTVARQDSPRMRDLAEGIFDFPGMGQ